MPELAPALHAALADFAAHERVLVALDFDGTMSPLVDRPQDARPLPASAAAFEQLATSPGVYTAVVSGRNLQSLNQAYPEPRPEICIGSHGAERLLPEHLGALWHDEPLSTKQLQLLKELTGRLEQIAAAHANVTVEHKPSATVLHVRQAAPDTALKALAQAKSALQQLDGVALLEGKAVLEATVHHGDKGQSLQWLREVLDVQAVLFVGDDVTDENGFKVLGSADLGIKVGAGPTVATYSIPSPAELPDLLNILIFMRH
ncbi:MULTISPECIES: trehalose-phosphatase [Glutamicibacter]|uniref:Trehalose 6-phosphate phosphatase n=2 Tax=Glutamicibacter arilaitensis TaxID=256701 RepID=A0A2N7RZE4_9MICC|nr:MULTISPECIES: trehalose-phosphatase [Glutamicibacter]PMQ19259.1 trehalose-phosphatase [Glutamicibacter arilaitensis]CBT74768.1 trehalose-phosphatase [Glutamicibacter arilaitensis Re117]HCH49042.1 trehalose-phosphatase [Glutamicibacter sp.]